jgi:hypothetical protein
VNINEERVKVNAVVAASACVACSLVGGGGGWRPSIIVRRGKERNGEFNKVENRW